MRKAQHSVSLEKRVKLVLYNDRQQGFVSSFLRSRVSLWMKWRVIPWVWVSVTNIF